MSGEDGDPRESDPRHPRRRTDLVGHADAEARLLRSYGSSRMHHGWLFAGPKGIGKATLAYRLARFVLENPDPATARAGASLHVAPESHTARLIAAGGHPDLYVLRRPWDTKNDRIKQDIAVAESREASGFFTRTASGGGWRVCIADSMDDINRFSANALLKTLEEPPERTLLLLIAHRPGALLATIRSRVIALPMAPLSDAETRQVVAGISSADENTLNRAVALSGGSPGRTLELLDSRGAALFDRFAALKPTPRGFDAGTKIAIAEGIAARDAGDAYPVFTDLLLRWAGRAARERARSGQGAAMARAHDAIAHSLRQTDALNLDKRQTIMDAFASIEAALAS